MQETGNSTLVSRMRPVIRISKGALSFSVVDTATETQVVYEPYAVKSGMSMAANLREAFNESELLMRGYQRAQVMLDAPVLMVPVEEFDESEIDILYNHVFSGHDSQEILYAVLPNLNAVAVFSINKDLKLVLTDHFDDVHFYPLVQPVWSYLHKRSFMGGRRKLYGYFHDKKLEVFCFNHNRFRFTNSYDVSHPHDAIYFLLYIWKLLGYDVEHDEMHLAGDISDEREELLEQLRRYVQKVYAINASAEFNRSPVTGIKGMPFDLITLFIKGR